ncbi:branched-chain amino acid ABC transporter substrate-binding protein [Rhodopila globiformis]|uniref:Branched-chain amino acid ABC transporter substrate-binding protein n=1 Tax=Rhodopila globiformis TaxID=1071 RepID=A0A2S6NNG0_RHOGL|nr:branched-chain amino acid ABC transporter substrate-binding protein [Rhodopila globiformis]
MGRPDRSARNGISRRGVIAVLLTGAFGATRVRADVSTVRIGYIRSMIRHPTISLLDQPTRDAGLAGAKLGLDDDNTTGSVTGQNFELIDVPVRKNPNLPAALDKLAGQNARIVMTDLPAGGVLALADAARPRDMTIINIAAPDDSLREQDCRANMIHVAPTRSMLADAVAQYLVWKKWTRWLLVVGSHPSDQLLAEAYRRAAKRFGARIVMEKVSEDTGGSRESDSGVVQTQQQMPVLTQGAPDYDVLVAADENQVFAGYLPYRTWDPRPVAGSAGLEPVTWDASSESWGGTQLQDRFERLFHRRMMPLDMQAWTGVRIVGEAAARSGSTDPDKLVTTIKSPDFGIAAYKGQLLTLRDWDLQLRQPILLADGRTIVSISPQPGFLHQVTTLDTLGVDRPETKCKLQ